MPEGDTIYKVAAFMRPRLVGQELAQVRLLGAIAPSLGRRRVVGVRSWGKHLLITLTPEGPEGYVLRVHLGMHGTWHSYPAPPRPKSPIGAQDVVLKQQDGHLFVCYRPEDAEVLRVADIPTSGVLGRLGPCLLADDFAADALVPRLHRVPDTTPLIDVLLGQHIAAGLGNVYKSELLFLHNLHPLTPKGALALPFLLRLFCDGRTLLQRNVGGWPRTITFDRSTGAAFDPDAPRYFVYGRANAPCLRCGSPIERHVWGRHNRSCYHCPTCQPEGAWQGASAPGLMPKDSSLPVAAAKSRSSIKKLT